MERSDTQPLFEQDDFENIIRDNSLFSRIGLSTFNPVLGNQEPYNNLNMLHPEIIMTDEDNKEQIILVEEGEVISGENAVIIQENLVQNYNEPVATTAEDSSLQQWEGITDTDNTMLVTLPAHQLDALTTAEELQTLLMDNKMETSVQVGRQPPAISLNNFPGYYNFNASMPVDNKDRNKWCFSQELKKLYVCPNVAVPVCLSVKNWVDATITITPVFKQSQYIKIPVSRCFNCKNTYSNEPRLVDYLVQVDGEGVYSKTDDGRNVVTIPLVAPPPGETVTTILLKLTCLTSCVGGPNRRPFALVLSLRTNGFEIGRQVLDVKCCKCPSRDLTNDEKSLQSNNEEKSTKVITLVRKTPYEFMVETKKPKRPKVKAEPGTAPEFVNMRVPKEFVKDIKRVVNQLTALKYTKAHFPGILPYSDEEL